MSDARSRAAPEAAAVAGAPAGTALPGALRVGGAPPGLGRPPFPAALAGGGLPFLARVPRQAFRGAAGVLLREGIDFVVILVALRMSLPARPLSVV